MTTVARTTPMRPRRLPLAQASNGRGCRAHVASLSPAAGLRLRAHTGDA
jgi:hypothetical protein